MTGADLMSFWTLDASIIIIKMNDSLPLYKLLMLQQDGTDRKKPERQDEEKKETKRSNKSA